MTEYHLKTFDDDYGRHALVFDGNVPRGGRIDVAWLLHDRTPGSSPFHSTRLRGDYRPRHGGRESTTHRKDS